MSVVEPSASDQQEMPSTAEESGHAQGTPPPLPRSASPPPLSPRLDSGSEAPAAALAAAAPPAAAALAAGRDISREDLKPDAEMPRDDTGNKEKLKKDKQEKKESDNAEKELPGDARIRGLVGFDRVSDLFEAAGAGDTQDAASWNKKFQAFTSKTLAKQAKQVPKADLINLKFDMLGIVAERLGARCKNLDPELADATKGFHAELRKLFNEALTLARESPNGMQTLILRSPEPELRDAVGSKTQFERRDGGSDDGQGEWFDGRFSVQDGVYPGVLQFCATARRPTYRTPVVPYGKSTFHFGDITDSDDDGEDSKTPKLGFFQALPMNNLDYSAFANKQSATYTDIHSNCKARLYSLHKDESNPEKVVTAGQLRQIMAGCLEGKELKDKKCREHNNSIITLESFLIEYLEARYDSEDTKDIQEWFHALGKTIKTHGMFDSEVTIFGKMLKNTLPESFPEQQRILLQTAEKYLKDEIGSVDFNQRKWTGVPLKAFHNVVHKLFNITDGIDIMKRVRDPLPKHGNKYSAKMDKLSQDLVCWKHGVEVILTFNMNIQDDFLADFIKAFQAVDPGHDGTCSAGELQKLVHAYGNLDSVQDGSHEFLVLADARIATMRSIRKSRRLTFSESTVHFIDLLNARWALSGKKGKRYEYHDRLKNAEVLLEIEKEKQRLVAEEYAKKSARQKRIGAARRCQSSDPTRASKFILGSKTNSSTLKLSSSGSKRQIPTPSDGKTVRF